MTESSNIVQTREENPQRYPEEIRKSEDNYENIVSDEDVNVNKERRLSTEDTSEKTEQKVGIFTSFSLLIRNIFVL